MGVLCCQTVFGGKVFFKKVEKFILPVESGGLERKSIV